MAPSVEHAGEAPEEKAARSLHILLVDDQELIRAMVAEMLAQLGHRVDFAGDGEEAVAAVRARRYDLVLMDVQMPRMDGVAAASAIRTLAPPANAVPIVALTAHDLESLRGAYLAAGMDDYLTKPIRRAALVAMLARWSARVP